MTPEQVHAKALKRIAKDPALEAAMRAAWQPVWDLTEVLSVLFSHPRYAAQQMHTRGRLVMLTRMVEGDDPHDCAMAAIDAVAAYHEDREKPSPLRAPAGH